MKWPTLLRSRAWWTVMALAAMAAGACSTIIDVALPTSAQPLVPPEVYARWWAMTEACSGATGSLSNVTWFEVPDATAIELEGHDVEAYWSQASNRIVLTGRSVLDGGVVRHEMLHALLRGGGHPRNQFLGKCAGVVNCPDRCISDGGPAPAADPGADSLPPRYLEVSTTLGPVPVVHTRLGDVFGITVTVRNPTSRPAVAVFPLVSGGLLAYGFLYELTGPTGGVTSGVLLRDPSRWTFAPGESKQQLFDFPSRAVFGVERYAPGPYQVRGAYGGEWSAWVPFTIAP